MFRKGGNKHGEIQLNFRRSLWRRRGRRALFEEQGFLGEDSAVRTEDQRSAVEKKTTGVNRTYRLIGALHGQDGEKYGSTGLDQAVENHKQARKWADAGFSLHPVGDTRAVCDPSHSKGGKPRFIASLGAASQLVSVDW